MAEEALKDQSGYCRKERKKTQKTGNAGNETGQSQDGSPILSSFRLLRLTLFPLVAALTEGFVNHEGHEWSHAKAQLEVRFVVPVPEP